MIRLFFLAMLAPIALALLWQDAPEWLLTASFVVVLGAFVAAWATGRIALRCPYCRKRVKIGATHCHHCGREAVRTKAA